MPMNLDNSNELNNNKVMCIFAAFLLRTSNGYVCKLTLQWDPSERRERWSLPSRERCFCQGVMKLKEIDPTCRPSQQDEEESNDLWFTDSPDLLAKRENWKPTIMDTLLERVAFCCKL